MTVRKLTEWQMRWSLILLWYNFFILYLLSKQNERTDALLRQKQNVSMNLSNDRVQHCTTQIIHSEMISKPIQAASMTVADILISVLVQDQNLFDEITDLKQMWVSAEAKDELYNKLCQTICKKQRSFSTVLKVRIFIMKCFLSDEEKCYNHAQLKLTEWVECEGCIVSDMRWRVRRRLDHENVKSTLNRLSQFFEGWLLLYIERIVFLMKTIVFNSIQVINYWFTLHRALRLLYQQAQTFSPNIWGISDQDVTLWTPLQYKNGNQCTEVSFDKLSQPSRPSAND